MEVEEEEGVNDGHVLPQNKLRKKKKRLDAINLRKKIIAEIYKRDSNIKRRRGDKQPEKEREDSNQRSKHRPFPNTTEPQKSGVQTETEIETKDRNNF